MNQERMTVPGCELTTVRELPERHGLQFLEVNIMPGGEVPLHIHECAATMIVTFGTAYKLMNGEMQEVKPGDVINKAPKEPHGFTQIGKEGFQFISLSDKTGIVGQDDKFDMKFV